MREKMRKLGILGFTVILMLSACGEKQNDSDGQFSNNNLTEAQISWRDEHISLGNHYEEVLIRNDVLYGYYVKDSKIVAVSQSVKTGEVFWEAAIPNLTEVNNITADAQGNMYLSGNNAFWKISSDKEITMLDNFLLEDTETVESIYPKGLYIDGKGHFFLHYEMLVPESEVYENRSGSGYAVTDRIYVTDGQLNTLFYEQIPNAGGSQLLSFSFDQDGVPTILAQNTEGIYICEIDIENRKLSSERSLTTINLREIYNIIFTENGFIYCKGNDLYQYDYKEQTQKKFLNLLSCGIMADDIIYMNINDGTIEIVDNYNVQEASEYVTILEGDSKKTTITLGIMQSSTELEKAVVAYNRFSKEGKVEIVEYYEGDYNKALDKLKLDIISGNAPDIMNISNINAEIFADKGVFADLYQYMEEDEELHKEMLLEPVRKAYESDGHLYSMGAAFQLHTMWGASSVFENKTGISMSELQRILESRGKTINAVYGFSADEPVLTTLTTFALDEFIDWDSKVCSFSNEYMRNLLDFAANYTGGVNYGSIRKGIEAGEILLVVGQVSCVADYQIQRELFGGEISFVGYPTVKGNGTGLGLLGGEMAINANGSHDKLAWDFVKYYIRNGYMGQGFPTLKVNFDAAMQAAMQEDISVSADGTNIVPKKALQEGPGSYVYAYAASQAEVDAVVRLIESTEARYKYNVDIQNIINEEAASYFSGQKDFETVADIIQNRVQNYLDEHIN